MTPDRISEVLRSIASAVAEHDQSAILAGTEELIEDNLAEAALRLWSNFASTTDIFLLRVLSYVLAKAATARSPYLWGPISSFVYGLYSDDEATLLNVLSAIQLYDQRDDIFSAILAPEFGTFSLHCAAAPGQLVPDAFCDLLLHLNDRDFLRKVLSRTQALDLVNQLQATKASNQQLEIDEAIEVLQDTPFVHVLPDITPHLVSEEQRLTESTNAPLAESTSSLLRSITSDARTRYYLRARAAERGGVVQEIRLNGGDPSMGRLAVDVFEKLVRPWKNAIRDITQSFTTTTTYLLAPAQGSFIIRFLIESEKDVSNPLEQLAELVEKPDTILTSDLNPDVKSNVVQFLETLAQNNIDARVGLIEPQRFARARRIVSTDKVNEFIEELRANKTDNLIRHEFVAILEGASYRQGTFETRTEQSEVIKGDVPAPLRPSLLRKTIGSQYKFTVQEHRIFNGLSDEKPEWTLLALDMAEANIPEDDRPEEEPQALSTNLVPQQDNLDRIIAVIKLIAEARRVDPTALGMPDTDSSVRAIYYMRQAASILKLLGDDRQLTAAGRTLAQLPESRATEYLSIQFELTAVGRLWKTWANVTDLHLLDENTAEAFLLENGLTEAMAKRRGRTLRRWLQEFKKYQPPAIK